MRENHYVLEGVKELWEDYIVPSPSSLLAHHT